MGTSIAQMKYTTGGQDLCITLEELGVTHIFGLPGTQNINLFEALRQSSIRTILATHELAAGFMANGYYRASGKVGVLTTIPGPGFAYTLAAIAEASQDSAALLYIVGRPASERSFSLQAIDQRAILAPLVKRIVEVERATDIGSAVREAYSATTEGEPGPVMLHIDERAIDDQVLAGVARNCPPRPAQPETHSPEIQEVVELLQDSKRAMLFLGQGAIDAARPIRNLVELLQIPVVTTRSGRGILPEDHPLVMTFDISEEGVSALNGLLDRSDLILAVGCKFTHNGTYGFKLHLPKEKLIHIDASSNVLNANYPARLAVCADSAAFFNRLYVSIERLGSRRSEWAAGELAGFKRSCGRDVNIPMPTVHGVRPPTPLGFFQALRAAMPANSCLVTDSGLHQVLASCYFRVNEPRGMIIPSDFQSMGFGLPAAVGAKLATPEKSIVVLIGDGGLAMSGMELITAVREQIPLTLIVFNDGALGQIRFQQLSSFGHSHSTKLKTPDLSLFAQSIGANYIYLEEDAENVLRAAVTGSSVTLIEVSVEDSAAMYFEHAKGLARQTARQLLKPSTLRWLKHKLSR